MRDRVSRGLDVLAKGLRQYVADRAPVHMLLDAEASRGSVATWDALSLLVFMWDHWNDVFRHDLTFVERSLVSELREYRNRWAHQQDFTEPDTYRIMDNIERLLIAVKSDEVDSIRRLRRESLRRLWSAEIGSERGGEFLRNLWPYLMCGASGLALGAAIIAFGPSPWSWMLSVLVFLAMMRIAWWQTVREALHRHGPHECSQCGCIIYTERCPYCRPALNAEPREVREKGVRLPAELGRGLVSPGPDRDARSRPV